MLEVLFKILKDSIVDGIIGAGKRIGSEFLEDLKNGEGI